MGVELSNADCYAALYIRDTYIGDKGDVVD